MSPTPCPFCGATNTQVVIGTTFRWIKVECNDCGAACGEVRKISPGPDITPEDQQAAFLEWNTRQPLNAG